MDVDETRRDDQAIRIDLASSGTDVIADSRDGVTLYGDVGVPAILARTIDHDSASYYQVMHDLLLRQ